MAFGQGCEDVVAAVRRHTMWQVPRTISGRTCHVARPGEFVGARGAADAVEGLGEVVVGAQGEAADAVAALRNSARPTYPSLALVPCSPNRLLTEPRCPQGDLSRR